MVQHIEFKHFNFIYLLIVQITINSELPQPDAIMRSLEIVLIMQNMGFLITVIGLDG